MKFKTTDTMCIVFYNIILQIINKSGQNYSKLHYSEKGCIYIKNTLCNFISNSDFGNIIYFKYKIVTTIMENKIPLYKMLKSNNQIITKAVLDHTITHENISGGTFTGKCNFLGLFPLYVSS